MPAVEELVGQACRRAGQPAVGHRLAQRARGDYAQLRQAADLDYRLTVLADGCLDADPDVHRALLEKVFPRQAEVVSIADWRAGLDWARPAAG